MGGIDLGSKGKEQAGNRVIGNRVIGHFDEIDAYAKRARKYYGQGFEAVAHTELSSLIWHATLIKEQIEKEHPEYYK